MRLHPVLVWCACLSLAACGPDSSDDGTQTRPVALDCGDGDHFEFLGDEVCVYDEDADDDAFTCPDAVPSLEYFDGFIVCSEDGVDNSIEDAVYDAYPELRPEPPPPCTEDEYAPNQTEQTARTLTAGESYDLIVCPEEDYEERWDHWNVELEAGEWVTAIVTSENYAIDIRPTSRLQPNELRDSLFSGIAGGRYAGPWRRNVGAVSHRADEPTTYPFTVARLFGSEYESHEYHLQLAQGCYLDADCEGDLVCDRQLLACLPKSEATCGDDAAEPNNTDSNATPLATDGTPLVELALCDEDADMFAFVADAGDSLEITIEHDQGEDGSVAIHLLREDGKVEASEARASHEGLVFRMSHVSGGPYRLLVDAVDFEADTVRYDIALSKASGACQTDMDCSQRPTPHRAHCEEDGVCRGIDGRSEVPLGGNCDDDIDCQEGDFCSLVGYVPDQWICTTSCQQDDACAAVGPGAYCDPGTCPSEGGICLPACESDAQCPGDMSCSDGRCSDCSANADCGEGGTCVRGACVDDCDDYG